MNGTETLEQIVLRIRTFIFDNYLFGYDENEFSDDASFLDYGVMDSLGIMELITFIEREFTIEVADSEIIPDNLDSVSRVSRYIFEKTRASATGGITQ